MAHGPPARRKTDNELDSSEEDEDMPVPPDGGWGWVVVFGSFMVHVISKYLLIQLSKKPNLHLSCL